MILVGGLIRWWKQFSGSDCRLRKLSILFAFRGGTFVRFTLPFFGQALFMSGLESGLA